MSHDMTKVHSKDCQCVRCKPLERPCNCDHCLIYSFKRDLKALLGKYNASIDFEAGSGSDTYGLYDEKMVVCFGPTVANKHSLCFDLCAGWGVGENDL